MLGANKFVLRQTKDSKFSHYDGSIEDVLKLAAAHWSERKPGYMSGVVEVSVPAKGFYSGVVKVTPGMDLSSECAHRKGGEERGEEPFIQTVAQTQEKQKATYVVLIFYHEDRLDDAIKEWELITMNASLDADEPMPSVAMARNILGLPGGNKDDSSTVQDLARSVIYWSTRAMIG